MGNQRILTIDTSTTAASIAITHGESLLAEMVVNSSAQHGDHILQYIEQLLTQQDCSLTEIDAFSVINGPGSFTGLRIGVATAKGLASACCRPLFAVSTLEALACGLPFAQLPVCVLIVARKREVYTATYSTVHGDVKVLSAPRALSPRDLLDQMDEPAIFVGSGVVLYRELIVERYGSQAVFAPWDLNVPRASSAARIAYQFLSRQIHGDPSQVLPCYIRPSDAEIAQKTG